jgi:tripartite-type tricarboxylate transporter receptor subunit TctC
MKGGMMGKRKFIPWATGLLVLLLFLQAAMGAETFPSKPLELIVPFAAGGSTDVMARTVAARAAPFLDNQPCIVVNKTGAGSVAAAKYVLDGRNDGYTLMSTSTSSMMVAPVVNKTNYTWRDFVGIAQVMVGSEAFYVRADSPFDTLEKFVEYAKQNPGKIKYGSPGVGSQDHLAMEGFAAEKGIVIKHIPTRGDPEIIAALLGGHVACVAGSPVAFKPYVDSGKFRCLGQFGTTRDQVVMPNVPTFLEQGIHVAVDLWRWFVVPKSVPPDRVKTLGRAFKNIILDKATLETLTKLQCWVDYQPPEEYERLMSKSETAVAPLIKLAKILEEK